jgi:hypothetical protein
MAFKRVTAYPQVRGAHREVLWRVKGKWHYARTGLWTQHRSADPLCVHQWIAPCVLLLSVPSTSITFLEAAQPVAVRAGGWDGIRAKEKSFRGEGDQSSSIENA